MAQDTHPGTETLVMHHHRSGAAASHSPAPHGLKALTVSGGPARPVPSGMVFCGMATCLSALLLLFAEALLLLFSTPLRAVCQAVDVSSSSACDARRHPAALNAAAGSRVLKHTH